MMPSVNLKNRIWEYLSERYEKTKCPYYSYVEIQNTFGKENRAALNELREEGLIVKTNGSNGPLIKIIKNEQS